MVFLDKIAWQSSLLWRLFCVGIDTQFLVSLKYSENKTLQCIVESRKITSGQSCKLKEKDVPDSKSLTDYNLIWHTLTIFSHLLTRTRISESTNILQVNVLGNSSTIRLDQPSPSYCRRSITGTYIAVSKWLIRIQENTFTNTCTDRKHLVLVHLYNVHAKIMTWRRIEAQDCGIVWPKRLGWYVLTFLSRNLLKGSLNQTLN